MELTGHVKNYEWGKLGEASAVAQLVAHNDEKFVPDKDTPYSELWMGSHPSGQSKFKASGNAFEQPLPFLFKVLSIGKALSIQVHPNKIEAEMLHGKNPEVYKDPNHKPELAIALTPFVGLCGFRPHQEIVQFIENMPPLKAVSVYKEEEFENLKNGLTEGLRSCYENMMTTDVRAIVQAIDTIAEEFDQELRDKGIADIFRQLRSDYPQDVGVLSVFFLNVVHLAPGEAMYLGAKQIHAYLSGDCVECMACSDNVIRAGLTPKFKDLQQLFNLLDYSSAPASNKIFKPERIDDHKLLFAPPVDDFAVLQLNLPAAVKTYDLEMQDWPGILLVVSGKRKLKGSGFDSVVMKRGTIVFIPKTLNNDVKFTAKDDGEEEEFVAFISFSKIQIPFTKKS